MLGKQASKRKAYIAKACDGDVHSYLPAKLTFKESDSANSMSNLTALFVIGRIDSAVCTRFSRSLAVGK